MAEPAHAFLRACRRLPVGRVPVWMMRQAGRYQPSYRQVREKVGFLELCRSPELIAQVTASPIEEFGFDAAILFSDILIPVEAMGMELDFVPHPVFTSPVREGRDVDALVVPDPEKDVPFVLETVRILRRALEGKVPLIGFTGSPFTLACYMIEGGGSKDFSSVKTMCYRDPGLFDALMKKLVETVAAYLDAQIGAGAQAVQIFDTWGGLLAPDDYAAFDLAYTSEVVRRVKGRGVPVIYYVGDGSSLLEQSAGAGADVIGLDWRVEIGEARRRLGAGVPVQGNLDPLALLAPVETVRRKARAVIDGAGTRGHIFNLGHGITPPTPWENARDLVETVHEYSAQRIAKGL